MINQYSKGIFCGVFCFVIVFALGQLIYVLAGELNLKRIITLQQNDDSRLFSSGINQNVFQYKLELYDYRQSEVVAIGSSRAMQIRQEFLSKRFTNLGGAVSNISDLEAITQKLSVSQTKPKMVLLLLDPWWFNINYPTANQKHVVSEFPSLVSLDLLIAGIRALKRGNWLKMMAHSDNLGIHAILSGEGFSADGSYHYTGVVTSKKESSDIQFHGTLNRIATSSKRFERASKADVGLVQRACTAILAMNEYTHGHVVIIAPPFSSIVWRNMKDGYGYIADAYGQLSSCLDMNVRDFSDIHTLIGATDCEFVDGFHGGDVIYARLLDAVAKERDFSTDYINLKFISEFIQQHAGHAAGMTVTKITTNVETDFLDLGCHK